MQTPGSPPACTVLEPLPDAPSRADKNDDITAPQGFRRKTPVTGNVMLKPFQRSDVPYVCQKQRILAENPDVELTPVHVLSP